MMFLKFIFVFDKDYFAFISEIFLGGATNFYLKKKIKTIEGEVIVKLNRSLNLF